MKYIPRAYQEFTTRKIIEDSQLGAFLDMGLGKTASSLTAVDILLFEEIAVTKVLVIAPKRVAENVWIDEAVKWDHLNHLKVSIVLGNDRKRKEALKVKADIYVINRENVAWLVGLYQSAWPFKMVIIDESSSFKDPSSIRFKALKMVRPYMDRVIILTGTPASNGLMDLWAQVYLLDQGQRLGKFVTHYRDRFFEFKRHRWIPKEGASEKIYSLISDLCISMKSEDYLDMPPVIHNEISVKLSHTEMQKYLEFERDRVLEIVDAENITAVNAAVLKNKLLQFANGAIYDEEHNWHEMHRAKLEALEEAVEALNGQPVIIAYSFKHDLERIQKQLKSYSPRMLNTPQDVKDWNDGKIPVLLTHPASAGHGLNLQFGGHNIIWFGHTWSLELYQQFNRRLDRPGQKFPVVITKLIVQGTMDEEVIPILAGKEDTQEALMRAVKARIEKYRKSSNNLKTKAA